MNVGASRQYPPSSLQQRDVNGISSLHRSSSSSRRSLNGGGNRAVDVRDDGSRRWKSASSAHEDDHVLLHQTVIGSKKQQLDHQFERLAKQRAFIRHEKRKLLLQNALLESERERFDASLASDWFCAAAFPSIRDRRISVDVGGQVFEISGTVAAKDPGSLLAAFVADDSPLSEVERGCFRVDRDWWLFRYVLRFLRDGVLPQDPKLLRELYLESEFWRFESLRKAIEAKNMELLQLRQENDAAAAASAATTLLSGVTTSTNAVKGMSSALLVRAPDVRPPTVSDPSAWWREPPSWWGSGKKKVEKPAPSLAKAIKPPKKESEADAWWKSSTYRGTDYAQSLTDISKRTPDSASHVEGDHRPRSSDHTPRAPLVVHSTWTSHAALHE